MIKRERKYNKTQGMMMDRDTIEEIFYWRFDTSTVGSDDDATETEEEVTMDWTIQDQARWYRMCTVLKEMVIRIFPSLQSSTPSSLAVEDENYWIRRLYQEDKDENDQGDIDNSNVDDDKNDDNDDTPFLSIGDKNGFYKLRIPLLLNPDARKTICLLTMREVEWYDTDEKLLLKYSATQFLRFVNRFSVFAGHLFPGRFVVSCSYVRSDQQESGISFRERVLRDTTILDTSTGKNIILDEGGRSLEELYRKKIRSISTRTGPVASLTDLCITTLMLMTEVDRWNSS